MATLAAWNVRSLAVSKDGKWIAAGTRYGYAIVWDANTFEKVFTHEEGFHAYDVVGVDFSPNSARLLVASADAGGWTATVLDLTNRQPVRTIGGPGRCDLVIAAKYSPQGDRIATATRESVRVYSDTGYCFRESKIRIRVIPSFNTGLLWSNNHVFVVSASAIGQLDASTGSTVSEFWPDRCSNHLSCIALPQNGEFIAYSTDDTVTFWDTSTHTRLGLIQHTQSIRSIALSPDDRFLAIGGKGGKIVVKDLRAVSVSILYCWIIASLNGFTVNPPGFDFSLWTRTPIALSLNHHSLTLPTLHSIPGRRTGSQTQNHH